jgi:hypothetical protein
VLSSCDQIFDLRYSFDSAAGTDCCAVESRRSAGKVELTIERPASQKTKDEARVEDVAGSSGIHHGNAVGGMVLHLSAVPCEDAFMPESCGGQR